MSDSTSCQYNKSLYGVSHVRSQPHHRMSDKSTSVTVHDRSGAPISYHKVEGTIYPPNEHIHDFKRRLDLVRQLELRSTDIIQLGHPRSGNHWTFEITNMILHGTTEFAKGGLGERLPDWVSEEDLDALKKDTAVNRLFTGHLNFQNYEDQISEKKPKCVYILRNPKDVLSSMYNLLTSMKGLFSYEGTWDDFFELGGLNDFWYGGWMNHVQRAERFHRDHPEVPFHVICFEEMKQNPVKEIGRLAEFLECKDAPVEEIAKAVTFKNFQEKLFQSKNEEYQRTINSVVESPSTKFLHKGSIGTWKTRFTVAQNEQFDDYLESRRGDSALFQRVQRYL